jgi:CheY-like chemotaxis protein
METILLIEANPVNLLAMGLLLRSLGYTVLEVDSQAEAVCLAQWAFVPGCSGSAGNGEGVLPVR